MIPERLRWLVEPGSPPYQLGELFEKAGYRLYLVGGSVRDAFLGRPDEDLDFATDAPPDEIERIVRGWAEGVHTVGKAFGTIAARKAGRLYEITTFRREIYRDDSRKPVVTFSKRIEDDLARRDFTVNAVALRLPQIEVVDPYGGLADLAAGVLRTPIDPHESFSDDPLRMLRLFRFQATLGFRPDVEAVEAVKEMAGRLQIVSAERIRDEFSKLIVAEEVTAPLWGLVRTGLADQFIPELPALEMEQDPIHHHKDVLAHTIAVTAKTSPGNLRLRLAALLHDIGKPATREIGPDGVSFHHHEVVGARMARDRLRALRYPKSLVEEVSRLVFLHLRPHTLKMGWTDSAVRRYVRDAGDLLDDLNELVRCDVTTRNPKRAAAIQRRIDELERRIAELREKEELARMRPPIDGNQVMAYLGIRPGPMVGEIMDVLLEKRIEEGPYSEREAYETVRRWALERGLNDPGPPPPDAGDQPVTRDLG
ncbi:MAG: CCA tRNA nucleotidyltransferase [Acidimicrobiia bacterium]|nr:MAG: CCA tRNA nucleotidyltransferase [Acidimicrobiia bacterium]